MPHKHQFHLIILAKIKYTFLWGNHEQNKQQQTVIDKVWRESAQWLPGRSEITMILFGLGRKCKRLDPDAAYANHSHATHIRMHKKFTCFHKTITSPSIYVIPFMPFIQLLSIGNSDCVSFKPIPMFFNSPAWGARNPVIFVWHLYTWGDTELLRTYFNRRDWYWRWRPHTLTSPTLMEDGNVRDL